VGVNSGTDALHLALWACEIGPGDEVITVAHTAVATVAAIELVGATPVLVDIDPVTYTLDPDALAAAITPRTRAVIPVHLYGHPADLAAILPVAQAHGLAVIEDCAQAHGASYQGRRLGLWGDLACFSFYPTKNLGALGDGGAVVGRDPARMARVRLLREYGWTPQARYVSQVAGMNSRLDELQAAILRVKLRHLDAWNATRRARAAAYADLLPPTVTRPVELPGCEHVYHLYVVRSPQRDALRAALTAAGIGTGIHYPVPVHRQPAYAAHAARALPHTEQAAAEILSLPMHPLLTVAEVARVADVVRSV
jgi:dTDP-4-amino-4,6-dideoxygalactose transaminase